MDNDDREFWFNTKTKTVEVGKQVAAIYRIGPFKTYEDASRALEVIEERTKAWLREEDERD